MSIINKDIFKEIRLYPVPISRDFQENWFVLKSQPWPITFRFQLTEADKKKFEKAEFRTVPEYQKPDYYPEHQELDYYPSGLYLPGDVEIWMPKGFEYPEFKMPTLTRVGPIRKP